MIWFTFRYFQIDPESRPSCLELKTSFKQIITSLKPLKIVKPNQTTIKPRLTLPNLIPNHLTISTPNAIGEEMSRLDPYYIPSPANGMNPFLPLLGQNGKIMANCFSCVEFNAINWQQQPRPKYRKTVSLVGPQPNLDELIKWIMNPFLQSFSQNGKIMANWFACVEFNGNSTLF